MVALHGMGGNENSIFDGYSNGRRCKQARTHTLPDRLSERSGSASMYRGDAKRDVVDVFAEMEKDYFDLMPTTMYDRGIPSGRLRHLVGCDGLPVLLLRSAPNLRRRTTGGIGEDGGHDVPQFVVHGDADPTVSD